MIELRDLSRLYPPGADEIRAPDRVSARIPGCRLDQGVLLRGGDAARATHAVRRADGRGTLP